MCRCPIVRIPGRTFPVTEHYLEDILSNVSYRPRIYKKKDIKTPVPVFDDEDVLDEGELDDVTYSDNVMTIVNSWDNKKIDYDFLAKTVEVSVAAV